jgi:RNA polymerase sigma-70 factor (ECF subfamily)
VAVNDSIGRYEEQLKFKNWLFGVAVKKSRTWRRNTWLRRKLLDTRKSEVAVTALPSTATPDSTAEHLDEISHALDALSTKQREVVLLHTVDGLTCEEIAEALDIKVGVVWSRLHRARQTLMKRREAHESAHIFLGEL